LPEPILLMSYALGIGGSERQLTEMALALDRSEFTPHVACFRNQGFRAEELQRMGVPVLHLPIRSFGSLSAIRGAETLRKYLHSHRIRLVHTFDYPTTSFAIPAARLFGTPVVLSSMRCHRDLVPGWHRRFAGVTDRLADGIVVNCDFVRQHLMGDEGVPEQKIHLCYNGVDVNRFPAASRKRRPELHDAALVIGTVAALRPEKGLNLLLAAFAQIRRDGMKLVLVGSGESRPALESQVEQLGLQASCLFQSATNEVASWLGSIDIFVLPSRSEGLSNSLMEAMTSGCAVVASRVGGNPELATHGETGLLFQDGDVTELAANLSQLIDDADRRRRLGEAAGKRMCEHFSLASASRRLGEIYRQQLSRVGGLPC